MNAQPVVMVKARRRMFLLSMVLLLSLFVAACGGATTNQGNSSTQQGGALTVVPSPNGNFTDNFSPFLGNGNSGVLGYIYETLLYFNRQTGDVKPWLASSYQFSSDAKTLNFTLRNGVQWSDGKPFTSDDVAFTLNYMMQNESIDTSNFRGTIQSVTAPDANTVTVTFKQPSYSMLWYLGGQTYILPKHIWQSINNPATYSNPNPVGTGPFVLKSFTPQLYVYARNPHFWQPGKPSIDEIRYPAYSGNTSADLVLSQGSIDWAGVFSPNIQKVFVARDPQHNHYWFPPGGLVVLYLNLTKAPFNDLAVRQAISFAIDREQLYKTGEDGYEPVAHPTGILLPNFQNFLASEYANSSFAVDTAKANALLQGAGYKKGSDGIYVDKNGKRLSFNMNVVSGWTDWVTNCQIMASNLKAIGMDVHVNAVSYNSYFSGLQLGNFDTAISWTASGPTPYFTYNGLLASSQSAPVGKTAPQNWERWFNPSTDQLLKQYESTTDQSMQKQAIAALEKVMVEQVPAVPLIYGATWYEYSTARFVGWPDEQHPYAVPAPWSAPDNEQVALTIHKA